MASNYNKVTRPPVVFVRDGEARLVVRRETYDDLIALRPRLTAALGRLVRSATRRPPKPASASGWGPAAVRVRTGARRRPGSRRGRLDVGDVRGRSLPGQGPSRRDRRSPGSAAGRCGAHVEAAGGAASRGAAPGRHRVVGSRAAAQLREDRPPHRRRSAARCDARARSSTDVASTISSPPSAPSTVSLSAWLSRGTSCGSGCWVAATSAPRSCSWSSAQADAIEARTGLRLEIDAGGGAQPQPRARRRRSPEGVLTRDAHAVVERPRRSTSSSRSSAASSRPAS